MLSADDPVHGRTTERRLGKRRRKLCRSREARGKTQMNRQSFSAAAQVQIIFTVREFIALHPEN